MSVIFVTGANKGLGYETARQLIQRRHTVFIGARSAERGEAAARKLGSEFVPLDVTDDASVEAALGASPNSWGTSMSLSTTPVSARRRT
jgi:NADP-dependent 3-hydroxy acid dehydrogenase YdfG